MGTVEKIISPIASFFFHIGIFEVLGIQYESWTSILLFIGLSFVADAVTKVLFIFLKARYFLATGQHFKQYHDAIFRILLDFIAVHLIDEWMTSVHFSIFSEIGFVLIIYLIDTSLFRNDEKDSESRSNM
ncbi:YrvL family regulatory protein [Paenibacillus alvei]|uniref:YrvL family regulatory protein n=1 Tax=Paenibacillus alvei TaxID=44250 RepID=UPI00228115C5|nr:YrvL family regulatory protein [Paenibacillus alvei]MCY7486934.1 regulatory YrvL family protein [Paenibacillus alvei]